MSSRVFISSIQTPKYPLILFSLLIIKKFMLNTLFDEVKKNTTFIVFISNNIRYISNYIFCQFFFLAKFRVIITNHSMWLFIWGFNYNILLEFLYDQVFLLNKNNLKTQQNTCLILNLIYQTKFELCSVKVINPLYSSYERILTKHNRAFPLEWYLILNLIYHDEFLTKHYLNFFGPLYQDKYVG